MTERCRILEARPDEALLSRLHCWRGARVYFMRAGEGPVKIGWSYCPEDRRRQLQVASPEPLTIVATMRGGPRQESYLHEFFQEERLQGEWFRPSERLLRYTEACRRAEEIAP